jgi:LysM domain
MIRARAILALAIAAVVTGGALIALAERPPQAKDAEQRKALQGLAEKDPTTGPNGADEATADAERAGPRRDGAEGMMPGTHVVKKGDTLWGICDSYFHDPWRWPKVWAQNPDITNPHWIFPGQTIKLGAFSHSTPGATDSNGDPAAGEETASDAERASDRVHVIRASGVAAVDNGALREVGFVDTRELSLAGFINGSREEKIMLGSGDHAYIEFAKERPLKLGDRFTVYQVDTDHPVREPGSSLTIGYIVRIYGDIVIDALTDRPVASARLVNLAEPVERGYRVGPVFKQFKTVVPRKNEISTTGRVVAAIAPNLLIAQNMFVVLNRGSRHGVELGNRFVVIRQGDGYRPRMENWTDMDHRFPPDAVAELLTVDVREETSTAWVTHGNREIRIGDVADMRKGY